MEHGSESPLVTAQRSAILQIRGRYERGELPFDAFRDALNAITEAQSPDACAAILRGLPHSPLATLAALEPAAPAPSVPAPVAPAPTRRRITAIMSETKKAGGAWTLAPETHVRAIMGSVKLDLRKAQLPPEAHVKVNSTMSEVVLYIPDDVAVTVYSTAWMSEVRALGESVAGMVASGHEEYIPRHTEPRARLVIEVSALMASAHIVVVNANAATIADLARDALRLALEGVRRGLEAGASPATLPRASAQPGLPSAPAE